MDGRQSASCEALLDLPSSSTCSLNAPSSAGSKRHHAKGLFRGASYTFLMDPYHMSPPPPLLLAPPTRHASEGSWKCADDMAKQGIRRELTMAERYDYDLSKARLKASSRTSALLAGFAMICLVELQYTSETPHWLLIVLGVVTALLVSVHLLALMMSTCILPYMEAAEAVNDLPHIRLKFYIDLSWFFSTCVGLILFLVEIGIIFYVKFQAVGFARAGWITSAILVPVLFVFIVISCFIHRSRDSHSLERIDTKVAGLQQMIYASEQNLALMKTV